jgi:hypothetical protein
MIIQQKRDTCLDSFMIVSNHRFDEEGKETSERRKKRACQNVKIENKHADRGKKTNRNQSRFLLIFILTCEIQIKIYADLRVTL